MNHGWSQCLIQRFGLHIILFIYKYCWLGGLHLQHEAELELAEKKQ